MVTATLLIIGLQLSSPTHSFTVDDLLKLEHSGTAAFDAAGGRLVYEQMPPYDQYPDYGVDRIFVVGTGARLMTMDVDEPGAPKPLFQPDPNTGYRLLGFSPGGSYVGFYSVENGKVTLETYSWKTGKRVTFPHPPHINFGGSSVPAWVSDDKVVYSALPDNMQPWEISARRYTGVRLWEAWNKTWNGQETSATEVASYADGGGGRRWRDGSLVVGDARTGEADVLAEGLFTDLQVSPDGRYLAGLRQAELPQPDPDSPMTDWISARSQLTVFDLKTRVAQIVAPDHNVFAGTLEWSMDSKLAFFAWDPESSVRGGMFYVHDAVAGTTASWLHRGLDLASARERGQEQRPERPAWVNSRLAVLARELKGDAKDQARFSYRGYRYAGSPGRADWFLLDSGGNHHNVTSGFKEVSAIPVSSENNRLLVLADGHVWHILEDGTKVDIMPDVDGKLAFSNRIRTEHSPYESGSALVLRDQKEAKVFLVDIAQDGRTLIRDIPMEQSSSRILAMSASAGAVMVRSDSDDGARLQLARASDKTRMIYHFNSHLAVVAKPKWAEIGYSIKGDHKVKACILLPHDYVPGKRYPAIIDIYPSRQGTSCRNDESPYYRVGGWPGFYSLHLLAARGFIVFQPANPGALNRTESGPIAGMADVVNEGVDALIRQGYADPDRLGLIGTSQGGFSSLWLATQTDRFKAIVSINGWADLFSHYFEGGYLRNFYASEVPFKGNALRYESKTGSIFGIGDTPWDKPMAYISNSPIFQAKKIDAPVMLVHSDMDAFALSQYEEMFTALYRLRKEARLIRYWGEGHGPQSPANMRDMWHRVFLWYDKYLDLARDEQGDLIFDGERVRSITKSAELSDKHQTEYMAGSHEH